MSGNLTDWQKGYRDGVMAGLKMDGSAPFKIPDDPNPRGWQRVGARMVTAATVVVLGAGLAIAAAVGLALMVKLLLIVVNA